jgi:hypothetical protein
MTFFSNNWPRNRYWISLLGGQYDSHVLTSATPEVKCLLHDGETVYSWELDLRLKWLRSVPTCWPEIVDHCMRSFSRQWKILNAVLTSILALRDWLAVWFLDWLIYLLVYSFVLRLLWWLVGRRSVLLCFCLFCLCIFRWSQRVME